jgi:Uma2 family endonuclease
MVTTIVSPEKLQLPVGAVVRLPATWQEYQQLAQQRGDGSIPRIKYRRGEVLLMSPLPVHGRDAHWLSQIVVTLLDYEDREYDAFTPVTMDLPEESAIEPDFCFYINNWQAVSGKRRINWQQDPPPDLVIEVDVTSYSDVTDYLPYQVPEIWLWKKQSLKIYQLQDNQYNLTEQSQFFANFDLLSIVQTALQDTYDRNTSTAIRNLRKRLNTES